MLSNKTRYSANYQTIGNSRVAGSSVSSALPIDVSRRPRRRSVSAFGTHADTLAANMYTYFYTITRP